MVKARVWIVKNLFNGEPSDDDVKLFEEDLPELKEDEMLIEALYLSVDPYMRILTFTQQKVGKPMPGEQISRVIESKNKDFPVGTVVRSSPGWRSHTVITRNDVDKMPNLGDLPLSTALGVMGMPGMTSIFGFLDICKPKKDEVVVVSGAAGAVGSLVGQIAKIKGCKVIGFAGSEEKCKWIKELGFDYAFNYRTTTIQDALTDVAPDGVDCYFDNVGGETLLTVLRNMKKHGRVSIVGEISLYNSKEKYKAELPFLTVLVKEILIQGFIIYSIRDRWPEGEKQMAQWIKEGKIKYRETITEGFDKMYEAFRGLFKGSNIGKAIVKC